MSGPHGSTPPPRPQTAEEAFALIDAWGRQGRAQLERAQALDAALARLSVTAWSPDRSLAVTLDHAGLLVDVEITERALDLDATALGAVLTGAVRDALGRLEHEAGRTAAEVLGEEDPLARSARAEYGFDAS